MIANSRSDLAFARAGALQKPCPRCDGRMLLERDSAGLSRWCITCGYVAYAEQLSTDDLRCEETARIPGKRQGGPTHGKLRL